MEKLREKYFFFSVVVYCDHVVGLAVARFTRYSNNVQINFRLIRVASAKINVPMCQFLPHKFMSNSIV